MANVKFGMSMRLSMDVMTHIFGGAAGAAVNENGTKKAPTTVVDHKRLKLILATLES